MFSIFKEKPQETTIELGQLTFLSQYSKDQSQVNLELRILLGILSKALKRTSSEYFAAMVGLLCCFVS